MSKCTSKYTKANQLLPPAHISQYPDIMLQLGHHNLDHLSESVDWHSVCGKQDTHCS